MTRAKPVRWGPRWGKVVGQVLARGVYATKALGKGHVPREGALIFAGNHIGYLDGPIMYGVAPRRMHVMVKKEMFSGLLGKVLYWAGSIPVDRAGDRHALADARELLTESHCVGILPEGTRGTGTAASIASGIAWLALKSSAPIVPVAILGTRVGAEPVNVIPRFRRKIRVVFGEPFAVQIPEGTRGKAVLELATAQVQQHLAAHIERASAETGFALPEG